MALPLLKQQLDDIDFAGSRFRQRDLVWLRRAVGGFPNSQSRPLADWDDMRDGAIAIMDSDRFATLNDPEKLAQPGFELRDANLFHDHIWP
jgi:hypothetical protein